MILKKITIWSLVLAAGIWLAYGCGNNGDNGGHEDVEIHLPDAPTGIEASAGWKTVTLTWEAVDGANSYNIYYATESGVTTDIETKISEVTSESYEFLDLANSTTYYYIVTAENSDGEGEPSEEISATPGFAGALDTSFGEEGVITFDTPYSGTGNAAIETDSNQNIIIGFSERSDGGYIKLYRFNSDGGIDATFGPNGDGTFLYEFDYPELKKILIDSEGNIYIGFFYYNEGVDPIIGQILKIDDAGDLVKDFGTNGLVTIEDFVLFDMAIDGDDNILASSMVAEGNTVLINKFSGDSGETDASFTPVEYSCPGSRENSSPLITTITVDQNNNIFAAGACDAGEDHPDNIFAGIVDPEGGWLVGPTLFSEMGEPVKIALSVDSVYISSKYYPDETTSSLLLYKLDNQLELIEEFAEDGIYYIDQSVDSHSSGASFGIDMVDNNNLVLSYFIAASAADYHIGLESLNPLSGEKNNTPFSEYNDNLFGIPWRSTVYEGGFLLVIADISDQSAPMYYLQRFK